MIKLKKLHCQKEGFLLLLEGSLRSIPFNIFLSALLSLEFFYQDVSTNRIILWFIGIIVVSIIRWIYSLIVLEKIRPIDNDYTQYQLLIFILLTLLMGASWGLSYFIFFPYISSMDETMIILTLGGISAGAIVSLSPHLFAYYAYILPVFIPIIIYNYCLMEHQRVILATMLALFVTMLIVTAKINSKLLSNFFKLNHQKDHLIKRLEESNRKLEESNNSIRIISITDSLTGLYNRRYFDTIIIKELNRANRNNYPITLVMMDVDNFKYINDNFGHPCGDSFLIYIATILSNTIRRSNDIVARLGGDEFIAIMTNMPLDKSLIVCHNVQQEFDKNNPYKKASLSMGVISISAHGNDDVQAILSAADRLLYEAKEKGKNQIISKVI